MAKEKKELDCKMVGSVEEVNAQLKLLLDVFSEGSIVIAEGGESVQLFPTGQISLEIDTNVKSEKEKIYIELSWKKTKAPESIPPSFTISSKVTELAE
jgi:amphi-Trp domain-containing protein